MAVSNNNLSRASEQEFVDAVRDAFRQAGVGPQGSVSSVQASQIVEAVCGRGFVLDRKL